MARRSCTDLAFLARLSELAGDSLCSPLAPSGVLVPPRHVCSDWPPFPMAKFKALFQIKWSPGWLLEESHVEH